MLRQMPSQLAARDLAAMPRLLVGVGVSVWVWVDVPVRFRVRVGFEG